MHIPGDTYNCEQVASAPVKPLADRILPGEVLARQGFIDDSNQWRITPILLGEIPAPQNRNAHGGEIPRAYQRVLRPMKVVGRGMFEPKPNPARVTQRQVTCGSHHLHALKMREAIDQLLLHDFPLDGIGIARSIKQSTNDEYPLGTKPERHV